MSAPSGVEGRAGASLLVRDLAQVVTASGATAPLRGRALRDVDLVEDAYVLCRGETIAAVGRMRDLG